MDTNDKTNTNLPLETGGWEEGFIEKGAALEHARWARWQNYLHTFLVWNNEIQMWTLPHEKKEWWDSEIRTPYSQLTEKQKESDRKEVREYLPIINKIITHTTEQTERKVREEIEQEYERDIEKHDRLLEAIKNKETLYVSEFGSLLCEEDYLNFEEWVDSVGKPEGSSSEQFYKLSFGSSEQPLEKE